MTGHQFIRKLRAIGRVENREVRVDKARGKGSHVTVWFGTRYCVLPELSRELKTGTLANVLRALGVERDRL